MDEFDDWQNVVKPIQVCRIVVNADEHAFNRLSLSNSLIVKWSYLKPRFSIQKQKNSSQFSHTLLVSLLVDRLLSYLLFHTMEISILIATNKQKTDEHPSFWYQKLDYTEHISNKLMSISHSFVNEYPSWTVAINRIDNCRFTTIINCKTINSI